MNKSPPTILTDFNRQIETPTEPQKTANKTIFSMIITENQKLKS